jgi:hypothetical protein
MKIKTILEADSIVNPVKAAMDKRYASARDSLTVKELSLLHNMVRNQAMGKKYIGSNKSSDEYLQALDKFKLLRFLDDSGRLMPQAAPFLNWVNKPENVSSERKFIDKRADANDALTRGQLKRDNEWTSPLQKKARTIAKSLTDEEKNIFRKVYNRFLNDKTRNLALRWGAMPQQELEIMKSKGILNNDGNLTDIGEFVVKYFIAFKNDPDGLDRVGADQRVGNYGNAAKRRETRAGRTVDRSIKKQLKNKQPSPQEYN